MNTALTTATALEARAAWSTITEPGDATAGALTRHAGHAAALEALAAGRDTLLAALAAAGVDAEDAAHAAGRWLPRHNPPPHRRGPRARRTPRHHPDRPGHHPRPERPRRRRPRTSSGRAAPSPRSPAT